MALFYYDKAITRNKNEYELIHRQNWEIELLFYMLQSTFCK